MGIYFPLLASIHVHKSYLSSLFESDGTARRVPHGVSELPLMVPSEYLPSPRSTPPPGL